jgi:hypothetical protein
MDTKELVEAKKKVIESLSVIAQNDETISDELLPIASDLSELFGIEL